MRFPQGFHDRKRLKYNAEIVNENVEYVYKTGEQEAFVELLKKIALDPTLVLRKKKLCLRKAEKYKLEKSVQVIYEQI